MEDIRLKRFDQIVEMSSKGHKALNEYWWDYALYASFEYWMMAALLIVPLIVLFFKIDKSKIFLIGFYGYSVHVLFGYTDLFGRNMGYWNYPIPVFPGIPGLSLDTSLIPVIFMLVYQWTLNRKKNYYLYTIITAGILSFAFKPLLVALGMFRMYGSISYIHLFMSYLFVLLLAKFITNLFLWMQKKYTKTEGSLESNRSINQKE